MNTTTFVIAGNYHEYIAFLAEKQLPRNTKEFVFFSDPTHLISIHDTEVLCVGKYKDSPVYRYPLKSRLKQKNNIRFVDRFGLWV